MIDHSKKKISHSITQRCKQHRKNHSSPHVWACKLFISHCSSVLYIQGLACCRRSRLRSHIHIYTSALFFVVIVDELVTRRINESAFVFALVNSGKGLSFVVTLMIEPMRLMNVSYVITNMYFYHKDIIYFTTTRKGDFPFFFYPFSSRSKIISSFNI